MIAPSAAISREQALDTSVRGGPSVDNGAGSPATMESQFDRCAGLLHRYFMVRTGGDPHASDDLMQQLWIAAKQGAGDIAADQVEFWLRGVARRLVANHWRRSHGPRPDAGLAAQLADTLERGEIEGLVERREMIDQLMLAVTDLGAEDHEIIAQFYFRRVPQAVLAAQLGLSERGIEGRLYRARRALREKLRHIDEAAAR